MQISLAGTPEVKICIEERKRRKKETMMYEKKIFFLVSKSLGDTSSLSLSLCRVCMPKNDLMGV